jgi:hypothetical protein
MCLRGIRARVRGVPCVRQVIASPVAHGWLMVWAEHVVALAVVYESGGLRTEAPHINQPSSCPSSTCSGQGGDAQHHCPRPLKDTGTTLTTRRRRTVNPQDLIATPITPPRIPAAGRKATHRMDLRLQILALSDMPRVQRTTRYEAMTSPHTYRLS